MKKILATVALLAVASSASAQDGLVVGLGNFFSPIVSDLEKAIAFYRDGLGLDVQGAPANADQNPALRGGIGAGHDRDGGRQTHGAWTGDDKDS